MRYAIIKWPWGDGAERKTDPATVFPRTISNGMIVVDYKLRGASVIGITSMGAATV